MFVSLMFFSLFPLIFSLEFCFFFLSLSSFSELFWCVFFLGFVTGCSGGGGGGARVSLIGWLVGCEIDLV